MKTHVWMGWERWYTRDITKVVVVVVVVALAAGFEIDASRESAAVNRAADQVLAGLKVGHTNPAGLCATGHGVPAALVADLPLRSATRTKTDLEMSGATLDYRVVTSDGGPAILRLTVSGPKARSVVSGRTACVSQIEYAPGAR